MNKSVSIICLSNKLKYRIESMYGESSKTQRSLKRFFNVSITGNVVVLTLKKGFFAKLIQVRHLVGEIDFALESEGFVKTVDYVLEVVE